MSFFSSGIGVGIAWACTVISAVTAVIALFKNSKLKKQVIRLQSQNIELHKTIEANSYGSNLTNSGSVSLSGSGNVFTGQNSGGIKINM